MTLQDTITNLGTAIINLVNMRITKQVTAHCEEIETTLLELKSKVDELVENSSNSSSGDIGNEVLNVNRVDGEKVILTKEYLNKYLSKFELNFVEDLEIWRGGNASGIYRTAFTTNGPKFYKNNVETPLNVSTNLTGIMDSGALVLYWLSSENDFALCNATNFDTSEDSNEVLFIKGKDTVDRDGTNLGLGTFAIGGNDEETEIEENEIPLI